MRGSTIHFAYGPRCVQWSARWTRHPPCCTVLDSRYWTINRAAAVLIHDFDAMPESERNMVRWIFLDPNARLVYPDWPEIAAQLVAILRVAAGRDSTDTRLAEVVAELSEASPEFARSWADRNLFQHTYGPKRFHHEAIGTITVNYETMHLPADPGLSLILYTADPGSPSEAKLRELVGR
jgi:hypothetical protein